MDLLLYPQDVSNIITDDIAEWRERLGLMMHRVRKNRSVSCILTNKDKIEGDRIPRFSLTVLDGEVQAERGKNSTAVFLVPQGSETWFEFASKRGQENLLKMSKFSRMIFVFMNSGHIFTTLEDIQTELRPYIPFFAPESSDQGKIPFITVDKGIGERKTLADVSSTCNGRIVVEDVTESKTEKMRQLVFLSANQMQSQASMILVDGAWVIDYQYIPEGYLRGLIAGFILINQPIKTGSIIGLGGGGIAMFLCKSFPEMKLDVIELDPSVVTLAKEYFFFKESDLCHVHEIDGMIYLNELKSSGGGEGKDFIIIDVNDSNDSDLAFPPTCFLTQQCLQTIRDSLNEDGVCMINIGFRSIEQQKTTLNEIKKIFPFIYAIDMPGDINVVAICKVTPFSQPETLTKDEIIKRLPGKSESLLGISSQFEWTERLGLDELLTECIAWDINKDNSSDDPWAVHLNNNSTPKKRKGGAKGGKRGKNKKKH